MCAPLARLDSLRGEASAFPVLKSDGIHARLIIDPAINGRVHPPPPCGLVPLHDLLSWLGDYKAGVTIDFVSWFNQFFLSADVAAYFVFRARPARRGPAQYYTYTRMPMGFSYAPAVAQRVALLILRAAGLASYARCWIDNIIIAATDVATVRDRLAAFDRVCLLVNAQYRVEVSPGPAHKYLGLHLNFALGTYRFTESWAAKVCGLIKVLLHRHADPVPLRVLQTIVGYCVWASWVGRRSLLGLRRLLAHLAWVSTHGAPALALPEKTLDEILAVRSLLTPPSTYPLRVASRAFLPTVITTDSSSYGGAAVYTTDGADTVVNWRWSRARHINELELAALAVALRLYPWPTGPGSAAPSAIRWVTDSTVALRVVVKMYSKSTPLQLILLDIQDILELHNCDLVPDWIATDLNVTADRGSRILPADARVVQPVPPFTASPPFHPEWIL